MNLFDPYLEVRTSTLPNCGRGLFTKTHIPKGARITEYTGKITSWKDADHQDGNNLYIYFINRNHVIDASGKKDSFAHFANDARGITRVPGVNNNAHYEVVGKRVFVIASKDILPNQEIFVAYGKEYWDVIKKNGIM